MDVIIMLVKKTKPIPTPCNVPTKKSRLAYVETDTSAAAGKLEVLLHPGPFFKVKDQF